MSDKIPQKVVWGTYTAEGVTCQENALNGSIVRVIVERSNFEKMDIEQKRLKRPAEDEIDPTPVKKRGRPRKITKAIPVPTRTSAVVRKKERLGKAKYNFESNIKPFRAQGVKPRFIVTGSRIRKPSSRLSDFVVPSNKRFKSSSSEEEPSEESSEQASNSTVDRASKNASPNSNSKIIDPLDLPTDDEIVHSFLPFNNKNAKGQLEKPLSTLKSASNLPVNVKANAATSVKSSTPLMKQRIARSNASTLGDTKKFATSTPIRNKMERKSSGKDISNSKLTEIAEEKSKYLESNESKLTDNEATTDVGEKKKPSYILELYHPRFFNNIPKHIDNRYMDFNKLVRSLKLVKLPGPKWKIRIVVSKQQTITEVTFTNKEENERCVKFARSINGYVLTIGRVMAKLMGAPDHIQTFGDVSILLEIVHTMNLEDPIIHYEEEK